MIEPLPVAVTCPPASLEGNKLSIGAFPNQVKLKYLLVWPQSKSMIVSFWFDCLPSLYAAITCCWTKFARRYELIDSLCQGGVFPGRPEPAHPVSRTAFAAQSQRGSGAAAQQLAALLQQLSVLGEPPASHPGTPAHRQQEQELLRLR